MFNDLCRVAFMEDLLDSEELLGEDFSDLAPYFADSPKLPSARLLATPHTRKLRFLWRAMRLTPGIRPYARCQCARRYGRVAL